MNSQPHTTSLESRQKRRGLLRRKRTEWQAVSVIAQPNGDTVCHRGPWGSKPEAEQAMAMLAAPDADTLDRIAADLDTTQKTARSEGYTCGSEDTQKALTTAHEQATAQLRFDYLGQIQAARDEGRAEQLEVNRHLLKTLDAIVHERDTLTAYYQERIEATQPPTNALVYQPNGTFKLANTRYEIVLAGTWWQAHLKGERVRSSRDIEEILEYCTSDQTEAHEAA